MHYVMIEKLCFLSTEFALPGPKIFLLCTNRRATRTQPAVGHLWPLILEMLYLIYYYLHYSLIPIHFRACSGNFPQKFLKSLQSMPYNVWCISFQEPPSSHIRDIRDLSQPVPALPRLVSSGGMHCVLCESGCAAMGISSHTCSK